MSSLGDNVISSVLRETWYAFQQVFGILLSFCEINYVIYFISRPLLHPNMINYFTLKWLHVAFSAFKISYIIWNISSWEVFDTKIMNLWIIEKYFKNDWVSKYELFEMSYPEIYFYLIMVVMVTTLPFTMSAETNWFYSYKNVQSP